MMREKSSVNLHRMMELEMELQRLQAEEKISEKTPLWIKIGDYFVAHLHEPRKISRRKYLGLALGCGWFCGAHQFYAGHKVSGMFYLLFCWTFIPMAMTLTDVFLVMLRHRPDENGMIEL